MSGVVRRHDPLGEPIPLVLDSPHSGETYPEDFDHAPPRTLVRQAEDTHVARLWSHAMAYGATLIEATFPRAYIDANRSLDDIDPELLAQAWDAPLAPSAKSALGIGLVWRLARGGVPMYARRLRADEIRSRIDRCWRPYHAAVNAALDERHRAFGAVWHINCHSMPAVGDSLSADPGRERSPRTSRANAVARRRSIGAEVAGARPNAWHVRQGIQVNADRLASRRCLPCVLAAVLLATAQTTACRRCSAAGRPRGVARRRGDSVNASLVRTVPLIGLTA